MWRQSFLLWTAAFGKFGAAPGFDLIRILLEVMAEIEKLGTLGLLRRDGAGGCLEESLSLSLQLLPFLPT